MLGRKFNTGGGGGAGLDVILNLQSGIIASKNSPVTMESNGKLGLALEAKASLDSVGWNNSQPQLVFIKKTSTNKYILVAKDSNSTNSIYYSVYDSDLATQLRTWTNIYGNIHQGNRAIRIIDVEGEDRFLMAGEPNSGAMTLHLFQFNDGSNSVSRSAADNVNTVTGNNSNSLVDFCIDTTRNKIVVVSNDGNSFGRIRVKTYSGYAAGSLTQDGADQDYTLSNVTQYSMHYCAYDATTDAVYMICSKNSAAQNQLTAMKLTWDGTQYSRSGSNVTVSATSVNATDDMPLKHAFCANNRFVFAFTGTSNARPWLASVSITGGVLGTSANLEQFPTNWNNGDYRLDYYQEGDDIITLNFDSSNSDNDQFYIDEISTLTSLFNSENGVAAPLNHTNSSQERIGLLKVAGTDDVAIVFLNENASNDVMGLRLYGGLSGFFSLGERIGVLQGDATVDANVNVILDALLTGQFIDQDNTNNVLGQKLKDGSIPLTATKTIKPTTADIPKITKIFSPAAGTSSNQTDYQIAEFKGKGEVTSITLLNDSNSGSVTINGLQAVRNGIITNLLTGGNLGLILVANTSTGMSNHHTLPVKVPYEDGCEIQATFNVSNGYFSSVVTTEVDDE